MINLLMPAFLGAAAFAALPLVLHLLRLEPRKPVPFPTLRFLGLEALHDSRRHRLLRWWVLLLRCLIIALIALAFARPYWWLPHTDHSRAVVVVVDGSYSMQAKGRRSAVAAWLKPQIARLRPPDQLGVLALEPSPVWLAPLNPDLAAGRKVLQDLPAGYGTSGYRFGLEIAGAVLSGVRARRKEIVLAADEQRLGWANVDFRRQLPPGVGLLTAPVAPAPRRQAAVTGLRATRSGGRLDLDVTVRGFAPAEDHRTLTFYSNGRKLGSTNCTVLAGRTRTIHARYAVADLDSPLAIRVSADPDDLVVDDTAYAALPALNDRRVMLATAAAGSQFDYLAHALASVHTASLPAFAIEPLPRVRPWPTSAVAILRGAAPFRRATTPRLDAFLAAGGAAWIVCNGAAAQTAWLAAHGVLVTAAKPPPDGTLALRDLDINQGLFTTFAGPSLPPLLAARFFRGWAIRSPDTLPLARWQDGTVAVAELPVGAGRLLITGFGDTRNDSDFPVRVAFVPFVYRAVTWLYENPAVTPDAYRVGDMIVLTGAGTWTPVESPAKAEPARVDGTVTPTAPGLYEFTQGKARRYYAVNLDTSESDLSPWPTPRDFARLVSPRKSSPTARLAGAEIPTVNPRTVDERSAWWWLLVAAIAMTFIELGWANRTVS